MLVDDTKKWWRVQNTRGDAGYVPSNFVKKIKPSILSSLKSTLGRRKGSDVKSQLQTQAPAGVRNGDNTSENSVTSDPQLCDTPAIAKYAYTAQQPDELSLSKGDRVLVLEKSSDGWWKGKKASEVGWFPSNYVREESETVPSKVVGNGTYASPADPEFKLVNTIDTVVAVYPFSSCNPEELSFHKDELLEVLEKPSTDPEWWRARNQRGDVGLIPRNYVQSKDSGISHTIQSPSDFSIGTSVGGASSTSRTPSSSGGSVRGRYNLHGPLASKDWFWGNITRADAEDMLAQFAENGDFLLRISETNVSEVYI